MQEDLNPQTAQEHLDSSAKVLAAINAGGHVVAGDQKLTVGEAISLAGVHAALGAAKLQREGIDLSQKAFEIMRAQTQAPIETAATDNPSDDRPVATWDDVLRHAVKQDCSRRDARNYFEREGYNVDGIDL